MILTKIKDLFSKALIILSFFLFLSIFVYINYIASPSFKAPVLKSLALTLGFLLIFIAVDYFMDKFKNKKVVYYAIIGIIIFAGLLLRLYWTNSVSTIQISDFGRMWESAGEIAEGNFSRFQKNRYLYTYPHLAFTTLFYSLIHMITGSNLMAMKLVNIGLSLLTAFLVYLISGELSNGKKATAIFIMAINSPFIFFNNILDSQNLAAPVFYFAVLLYLKVFKKKIHPLYLVAVGALLSLGNLFRSVGPIFVIAIIMHMLIFSSYSLIQKRKKGKPLKLDKALLGPLCLVLMLVAMYVTTFVLNYIFIWAGVFQKPTWDTGGNLILYINAGFNHESNGMWNQEDYDLLRDVGFDYDKAEIEARKRLEQRLSDKDKVLTLISNKYRTQWGAGDFGGLYWSTVELESNPKATNDMLVWLNYHFYYVQAFYSALILAIMLKLARGYYKNEIKPEFYFGLILFVGFVCLHTLIEMQPRYGYIAMPMITALAAASIGERRSTYEGSV